MIKIEDVQKLREETGAGVMDCKNALRDSGGDFGEAMKLIRERGLLKAANKSSRGTNAGLLHAYIHNGRVGVLIEARCETDFVARSEPFQNLVQELVMQIAAMNPQDVQQLLEQPYVRDPQMTIDQFIGGTVARVGENIRIERFSRFELPR